MAPEANLSVTSAKSSVSPESALTWPAEIVHLVDHIEQHAAALGRAHSVVVCIAPPRAPGRQMEAEERMCGVHASNPPGIEECLHAPKARQEAEVESHEDEPAGPLRRVEQGRYLVA